MSKIFKLLYSLLVTLLITSSLPVLVLAEDVNNDSSTIISNTNNLLLNYEKPFLHLDGDPVYAFKVNKIDGTFVENYNDIDEAIIKASEISGTVVFLKDYIDVTRAIKIPTSSDITLDLNGKTISGTVNSSIISLTNDDIKLVIKNGNIVNADSNKNYKFGISVSGDNVELSLKDLNLSGYSSGVYLNSDTCLVTLDNCNCLGLSFGLTTNKAKTVNIIGGVYTNGIGAGSDGSFNISSGSFGVIQTHSSTINISGGNFSGGFKGQTSSSDGTINILGGNFLSQLNGLNTSSLGFNITGGYYENEPSDTFIVKSPTSYTSERTSIEDQSAVDIEKYKYKVVEGVSYVAKLLDEEGEPIDGKIYTSLIDAVTNVENGQIIKLLKNVDIKDSNVEITDKTITIDLNNRTVYGSYSDGVLVFNGNSKVLIKGPGIVKGSGEYCISIKDKAELILDQCTIIDTSKDNSYYGNGYAIGLIDDAKLIASNSKILSEYVAVYGRGNSNLTLNAGTYAAAGNFTNTYGAYLKDSAKLTVDGATLGYASFAGIEKTSGNGAFLYENSSIVVNEDSVILGEMYGVADFGENVPGGEITINGGIIKSTAVSKLYNFAGIYHPGGATLTINGGTIEGNTGVYAKSGKTIITGGKIIAHGDKQNYSHLPSGMISTGDALVVESCDFPSGISKIEVTGGAFYSKNGFAVASYNQEGYEPVTRFLKAGIYGDEYDRINILDVNATKDLIAEGYKDIRNLNKETKNDYPWKIGEIKNNDPDDKPSYIVPNTCVK